MKKIKWYWIPIIGILFVWFLRHDQFHEDFFDMNKPDFYGSMYVHITLVWVSAIHLFIYIIQTLNQ